KIVSVAAMKYIVSGSTGNLISAVASIDAVCAVAAGDRVGIRAAHDRIIASAAVDIVEFGTSGDGIVSCAAVGCSAAEAGEHNRVVAILAVQYDIVASAERIVAAAGVYRHASYSRKLVGPIRSDQDSESHRCVFDVGIIV